MSDSLQALSAKLLADLQQLLARHTDLRFASSLGHEDMVITDVIARHRLPVTIFTLDTGRLHDETCALLQATETHYAPLKIRTLSPDSESVESLVARQGINAFYDSLDARKACCAVRKIEPLKRALRGADAWLTGLRREQSETRGELSYSSIDPLSGLPKYNPLLDWLDVDIQAYLREYGVPVNALHAKGFPSIGCAPCTRAIAAGEHPRAGRWWWEQDQARVAGFAAQECGLHVDASGKLVRTKNNQDIKEEA